MKIDAACFGRITKGYTFMKADRKDKPTMFGTIHIFNWAQKIFKVREVHCLKDGTLLSRSVR